MQCVWSFFWYFFGQWNQKKISCVLVRVDSFRKTTSQTFSNTDHFVSLLKMAINYVFFFLLALHISFLLMNIYTSSSNGIMWFSSLYERTVGTFISFVMNGFFSLRGLWSATNLAFYSFAITHHTSACTTVFD